MLGTEYIFRLKIDNEQTAYIGLPYLKIKSKNELSFYTKEFVSDLFFKISGMIIIVLDKSGKVISINNKGCELLGYDKKYIAGKNWFKNFVPDAYSGKISQLFKELMDGKESEQVFENYIMNKNGEKLLIKWHSKHIKDRTGNIIGLISSGTDITEIRRLHDDLLVQTKNSDFLYVLSRAISDTADIKELLSKSAHLVSEYPGILGGLLWFDNKMKLFDCESMIMFGNFEKFSSVSQPDFEKAMKKFIKNDNLNIIEELYYDYYGKSRRVYASSYKMKTKNETQGIFIAVTDYMDLTLNNFLMLLAGELGRSIKRKKAEVDKKLSEEKFLTIFNTTPDAITITELENHYFLETNKSFEELTGYKKYEVLNKKVNDIGLWVHPELRLDLIKKVITEKKVINFETLIRKKNGQIINALFSSSIIYFNGFKCLISVVKDVSERVKIVNEIKSTKQLLEKITYTTPSYICLYDVNKDTVLYSNKSILESLGYTKADLEVIRKYSKTYKKFFYHKDDVKLIENFDNKMKDLQEGEISKIEYRLKDAHSNWQWFQQTSTLFQKSRDGKKVLTINVFENITDRKRAEDEIRKHSHQTELLYQAGKAISGTLDLNEIYDRMYQIISEVVDCRELIVTSYDHDDKLIRYKYLRARATKKRVNVSDIPPIPLAPRGYGIVSEVIRSGKSMNINNYEEYFNKVRTKYVISEEGMLHPEEQRGSEIPGSALIIPIILEGKILGVVQILSGKHNAFDSEQLKFIESLMQQVALANRNAIIFEQAQKEIKERKIAQDNLKQSEKNIRQFADSVPDVLYRLNYITGQYDFLSKNIERVLGYNVSEVQKNPKEFSIKIIYHEDLSYVTESIQNHLKFGKINHPLNIECRMIRKDGQVIWVSDSIIFEYKNGNIITAIGAMSDITEKKIEEENRRKRDERIITNQSALLELSKLTGGDFLENLKLITKITLNSLKVNRVCTWLFDSEKTELKCINCFDISKGHIVEKISLRVDSYSELIEMLKNDEKVSVGINEKDYKIKGFADYFSLPGNYSASLITRIHSRGDIAGFLSILSTDAEITEWPPDVYDFAVSVAGFITLVIESNERLLAENETKKSLHDKELLLREIHHRVKNNLQVISSMLFLQSKKLTDQRLIDSLIESQNRVKSMVMIHEKLYRSEDLASINYGEYINELANSLFRSYSLNSNKYSLELDIGNIMLDTDTAVHCGLIINELVSNAIKHAFPGDREGKISITFKNIKGNDFILKVADNGIGIKENFDFEKNDTLGMQLVKTLVEQLYGDLKISNKNGITFTINFSIKK